MQETSQIVSLFTLQAGRIDVTVRASRSLKQKALARPVPFVLLDLAWQGRGQLPYLSFCEHKTRFALQSRALYCGMYLNELLYRLLPKQAAEEGIFAAYLQALSQLASGAALEPCLRIFEWRLMSQLGYQPQLDSDAAGRTLQPNAYYHYQLGAGLLAGAENGVVGMGADFLGLDKALRLQLSADCNWPLAKRLMRYLINEQLGGKPLTSRQLFV